MVKWLDSGELGGGGVVAVCLLRGTNKFSAAFGYLFGFLLLNYKI